jgi:hypothetical protein
VAGRAAAACHAVPRPEGGCGDLWMAPRPELAAANLHRLARGEATPC